MRSLTLALTAALAASPAFAQSIYRWVDAQGTTHYTDNAASIPQGVTVFATDGEPISEMGKAPAVPVVAPAPVAVAVADKKPDEGPTANELYWRGQFRAVKDKIRTLEDELTADARRVEDVNVGYDCQPQLAPYGGYAPAPQVGGSIVVGPNGVAARFGPVPQPIYVYNQCIPRLNPEYERTQRRIEKNRLALARAKEDLHELERRAAFDAVPFEWRR